MPQRIQQLTKLECQLPIQVVCQYFPKFGSYPMVLSEKNTIKVLKGERARCMQPAVT